LIRTENECRSTVLAVADWQDTRDLDGDGTVDQNAHKELFGSARQPTGQEPEKKSDKEKDDKWWSRPGLSTWEGVKDFFP